MNEVKITLQLTEEEIEYLQERIFHCCRGGGNYTLEDKITAKVKDAVTESKSNDTEM